MHELHKIKKATDRSHKRLGNMMAVNVVAAIANKCVLNIGVAGCGKSTVTNTIKKAFGDNVLFFDSVTKSGLKYHAKELNGFRGIVIVDDIGKIDTEYTRISTVTTFAELSYSHVCKKSTNTIHLDIEGFRGAALMNVQPVIMPKLTKRTDWDANIRDKTIRYYHLYRVLEPCLNLPNVEIPTDADIYAVRKPAHTNDRFKALMDRYKGLWSKGRLIEHLSDMLRACAAIDGRNRVNQTDYDVLSEILTPLLVEKYALTKEDFEGKKTFRNNYVCLLTEFATYDVLTVSQLCENYGISKATAYRILNQYHQDVLITPDRANRHIVPSEKIKKVLSEVDIYG